MAAMIIDYNHSFSPDDARERLQVLGNYLSNRHGNRWG